MNKIKYLSLIGLLFVYGTIQSQSFNVRAGRFFPALNSDLWTINQQNLSFEKNDMYNSIFSLEWEHPFAHYFSLGFEISGYSQEVNSQYRNYEYDDGTPIYQNLSLKLTPLEVTWRFYPAGNRGNFNPYIGIGPGLYITTFKQWGEFINFDDLGVSEGMAVSRTAGFGFHSRAGFSLRFHRFTAVNLEAKYVYAKTDLSSAFQEFEALDLSGFSVTLGIQFFFR